VKSYKVVVEHDDHLYKIGTIVKMIYSYGSVEYAWFSPPTWGWYVDDEGIWQILHRDEIEEIV
jgi:hypothetical protein